MKNSNHQSDRKAKYASKRQRQKRNQLPSIHNAPEIQAITNACNELSTKITEHKVIDDALNLTAQNDSIFGFQPPHSQEKSYAVPFSSVIYLIENKTETFKSKTEQSIQQWTAELENINPDKLNLKLIFDSLKERRDAAKAKIKARYDKDFAGIKDEKTVIQEKIKSLKDRLTFITAKFGIPNEGMIDKNWFYGLIIVLLCLLEAPLSYTAIQALSLFNNINAMILSVGMGVVSVFSFHTIGVSLWRKKWLPFSISLVAATLLFAVIIYLRKDDIIISILPIVLGLIGIVAAYERAINSPFFGIQRQIERLQNKYIRLGQKEKNINNKIALETSKGENLFKDEANKLVENNESQKKEIQQTINNLKANLLEAEAFKNEKIQVVKDLFLERIMLFRSTIDGQFQKQSVAPIEWNNPPKLAEEAESTEIVIPAPNSISIPAPSIKDPFKMSKNGVNKYESLFVCLLLSLFMTTGCSPEEGTQNDIAIIVDKTDSIALKQIQSPEYIANYVTKSIYEFDGAATPDFGNVYINTIGESALSKTKTISLERGDHYFMRNEKERENQIVDFEKRIAESIDTVLHNQRPHKQSQLFRSLSKSSEQLQQSNAHHKTLILWSDLIESSPIVSFYKYKKHPKQLLKDYDKIVEDIEADGSIELDGIRIIVVRLPTKNDELGVVSEKFFKRFLASQNAEVTFVANL